MNKTLKPLFACLFSGLICTGAAAAEPQVINIKTDGSSMVMSVTSDGEVLFHEYRIALRVAHDPNAGRHECHPNRHQADRHEPGARRRTILYGLCRGERHHDARSHPQPGEGQHRAAQLLFVVAARQGTQLPADTPLRRVGARKSGRPHAAHAWFEEHRVAQAGTHDAYRESGLHDYARQRVVRRELRRGDRRSTGMER